jgi:hypothetical protein
MSLIVLFFCSFVGLVMVMDPPREESLRCVQECRQAGIDFYMVRYVICLVLTWFGSESRY